MSWTTLQKSLVQGEFSTSFKNERALHNCYPDLSVHQNILAGQGDPVRSGSRRARMYWLH